MRVKTIIHKISLLLFGLVFAVVLFELSLRLSVYLQALNQETDNRLNLVKKGRYVILCIGESTTLLGGKDSYPSQLQIVLNERIPGNRFTVINKGRLGTTSSALVHDLERNLLTYKPDAVVTMMGINDPPGGPSSVRSGREGIDIFIPDLYIYKLAVSTKESLFRRLGSLSLSTRQVSIEEKGLGEEPTAEAESTDNSTDNEKIMALELLSQQNTAEHIQELIREENYSAALPLCERSLAKNTERQEILRHLVLCYRKLGRESEAINLLHSRLEKNERQPWVWHELGVIFREQGNYDEAERHQRKSLEIQPKNCGCYNELGLIFRHRGMDDIAEQYFKRSIDINPAFFWGYLNLGELYHHHKKYSRAEEMYNNARQLNPKVESTYLKLSQLYQEWEKPGNAEQMQAALHNQSTIPVDQLLSKGQKLMKSGQLREAEHCYQEVEQLRPKEVSRRYVNLGIEYINRGEYDKFEQLAHRAIALDPHNDSAYSQLGRVYFWQKKSSQAVKMCLKALELNPNNIESLSNLGQSYQAWGRWEEAEEFYQRILKFQPGHHILTNLINGYLKRMQLTKAEERCLKSLRACPRNPRVLGAVIFLYDSLKNEELVKIYSEQLREISTICFNKDTARAYRKAYEITQNNQCSLLCMQYPMRPIQPLMEAFGDNQNVIFVDNEQIFKQAVHRSAFNYYFKDNFGGDFGHCTRNGNRLLAKHLADILLDRCFPDIIHDDLSAKYLPPPSAI